MDEFEKWLEDRLQEQADKLNPKKMRKFERDEWLARFGTFAICREKYREFKSQSIKSQATGDGRPAPLPVSSKGQI